MNGRTLLTMAVLVVALPLVYGLTPLGAWTLAFVDWLRGAGPLGMAAYLLAFVLSGVAAMPASWALMAAGFLYGPATGVGLGWLGAQGAAWACFALARAARRPGEATPLDRALARRGFAAVVLVRVSPLSPYHLVSYALGASRVAARVFVPASGLGSLPPAVVWVLAGAALPELAAIVQGGAMPGAGLVATALLTVGATAGLTWWARRALALAEAEDAGSAAT